ncbi:hypothetical protein [Ferrovibrio sp.]|nr:hypothetical protein [Ferrovibrio sp.]MBX3456709.1 hypothetical protein [Ferrovibrio sp.]
MDAVKEILAMANAPLAAAVIYLFWRLDRRVLKIEVLLERVFKSEAAE